MSPPVTLTPSPPPPSAGVLFSETRREEALVSHLSSYRLGESDQQPDF